MVFCLAVLLGLSATYAAFSDKGRVLGSTFSVGTADLKLFVDVTLPPDTTNLADEIPGPSFTNISSTWSKDYPIKFYNNSTSNVQLASNAKYSTVNDPGDLRTYIYVEPFDWNDTDSDGVVDDGEKGATFGKKTITKWSTEGFNLGTISMGQAKGYVLVFSTENLSDTRQGKTALFDFEFDGISVN